MVVLQCAPAFGTDVPCGAVCPPPAASTSTHGEVGRVSGALARMRPHHPAHPCPRGAFGVLKGVFMQVRSVRKVFMIEASDRATRRRHTV
uniref:Uncharacterized protein n=1 Tax=Streptomyces avermitilis TaxID=33903 RepID=A0A499V9N6_STRAX|nr:hypothetical protein SAVMC3_17270 [Streptomyces avermitilis]